MTKHQETKQFDRSVSFGEHVARGLYAGWRAMVFWDMKGLQFLEFSGQAVLRSFVALVFAVPLYLLTLYFEGLSETAKGLAVTPYWLITAGYVVAWPIFAFSMFYMAKTLELGQHFITFMTGYHWARVFGLLVFLPYTILSSLDLIPVWSYDYVFLASLAWVFYANTLLFRHGLKTFWLYAVFFTVLDMITFQIIRTEIISSFYSISS